ncbi:MAG: GerMN domain-containing protein [Lachnospiraceae bacterium]|nr:GerMN domain-containing protein [Lachnospiraceae bacterium]
MFIKKMKIFLLCLGVCLLCGCNGGDNGEPKDYRVFYVDKEETKVSSEEISIEETETEEILQALFQVLKTPPDDTGLRSAIPENVELESFAYADYQLVLNFNEEYASMSPTGEVLSRAAIVRTLCQVDGINYVAFNVGGEPLVNVSGIPVGYMSAEQFVDNAGDEINAYEKATLTLYFADESGSRLEAHLVERVYNSNISMDKLIVEELVAGPEGGDSKESGYGTISDSTEIISVNTRDGVCYVNFGEGFLSQKGNVSPEVAIYSVVNSLVELTSVNKVQISVEGNTNVIYMEAVPLSQLFERNLEIMKNAQ